MTRPAYESFDHTADLGLRTWGSGVGELYTNAARGMLSLAVDPETIRPGQQREWTVTGKDNVELLFEYLREILYQLNVSRVIWNPLRVEEAGEGRLRAVVSEDPIDEQHHRLRHEVKAVTYHGMTIEQTNDGWVAEAVFDV